MAGRIEQHPPTIRRRLVGGEVGAEPFRLGDGSFEVGYAEIEMDLLGTFPAGHVGGV